MKDGKLVVKLETSTFFRSNNNVLCRETRLTVLKSKSDFGFNAIGIDDPYCNWDEILNINDVPDGVYELAMCNMSVDVETGYADEWDYILKELDN